MAFARIDRYWPLIVGGVAAPVVLAILLLLLVKDGGTVSYQWLLWLPWVGLVGVMLQLFVNNLTHTVVFQSRRRGYNPGLVTTVFVLMPYCTLVIAYIVWKGLFTTTDWVLGIGVSLIPVLAMLTITMTLRKRPASAPRAGAP